MGTRRHGFGGGWLLDRRDGNELFVGIGQMRGCQAVGFKVHMDLQGGGNPRWTTAHAGLPLVTSLRHAEPAGTTEEPLRSPPHTSFSTRCVARRRQAQTQVLPDCGRRGQPVACQPVYEPFVEGLEADQTGEQFQAQVVNYADDFVILSRGKAAEALDWTRQVVTRLGLTLNEAKTSIKQAGKESFTFLGYTFGPHRYKKASRAEESHLRALPEPLSSYGSQCSALVHTEASSEQTGPAKTEPPVPASPAPLWAFASGA